MGNTTAIASFIVLPIVLLVYGYIIAVKMKSSIPYRALVGFLGGGLFTFIAVFLNPKSFPFLQNKGDGDDQKCLAPMKTIGFSVGLGGVLTWCIALYMNHKFGGGGEED